MKIELIGDPKVVMSNPLGKHGYFGWPSAARLKNGKIAIGASGFRLTHICPFGKAVVAFSDDDGETYTPPMAVIDTVLDDRDAGLTPFGESGLIVSSFNNTIEFQRKECQAHKTYCNAYLDTITLEQQNKVLGSTFRVSFDNGVTYGELYHAPVSSPHGPFELKNGKILYVGRPYDVSTGDFIRTYTLDPYTGKCEFVGEIEAVYDGEKKLISCEPHTMELDDGTLLCQIRVQDREGKFFTIYQSESTDEGKTWAKPHQILSDKGGAPSHVFKHSSGTLVSCYGYREFPYGVRVMFSNDNGKTWDTDNTLYENEVSGDLGYPETVELPDGSMITIFYARPAKGAPAVVFQQKWRFSPEA